MRSASLKSFGSLARHHCIMKARVLSYMSMCDDFPEIPSWNLTREELAELHRRCAAAGHRFVRLVHPVQGLTVVEHLTNGRSLGEVGGERRRAMRRRGPPCKRLCAGASPSAGTLISCLIVSSELRRSKRKLAFATVLSRAAPHAYVRILLLADVAARVLGERPECSPCSEGSEEA